MPQAEKLKHLSEDQHGGGNGSGCNAKACYDCIFPIVLLLAYVKQGLPYVTTAYLMSLLYCLQYTMSTAYGLSEHTNWFDRIVPVFGIGQGASDGPTGWGARIDIVLKGAASLKTNIDAFVDNATLLHNNDQFNASAQILMTQVQHDA
eukprot:4029643-Ditylum_brightwellii.AAC.1